jgi:ParB family chromosome partitioning protein
LQELADSISRHGILQPLLVRGCGVMYEIIAGERRYRAAVMAGLETVPCIIKEVGSRSSAELAIIENLQREDLNMFEEAEAIQKLIETCNITQDAAALHLSCSQSYIANKLRLLKLPTLQRHAIIECGLTERHARALLRIHDNEDRAEILAVVIKRKLNVSATEDYIENHLCQKEQFIHAQKISRIEKDIKRKLLSKDMRLFYNSIDRAVTSVRDCGFSVDQTREVSDEGTLISIFIKKKE